MRQRILHVVPNLRYGSAARQAVLLAEGRDREHFECRVASLGAGGPAETQFTRASVPVTRLGSRGRIDPRPAWELRRLLGDFAPDVIHAWQPSAVRTVRLALALQPSSARLVVSRPLSRGTAPLAARFHTWMLRSADRIAVTGRQEMERCLSLGIPSGKLASVRVGVRQTKPALAADGNRRRYIACVGPIESHKGLKDAVWAFDVLHYIYKDLHLLLIGTGPDEPRLRKFLRDIGIEDLVHFLGDRSDLADLFALAELVWVPGRSGGVGAIVEAMAASRPVIATHLPESAEVLADGAAGCLVPANDPAELSRQTRRLMDDVELRARMGEAGRQRAAREFDAADMVRDYETIYHELTTRAVSIRAG